MEPSVTDWISAVSSVAAVAVGLGALVAVFAVRKQIKLQRRQLKLDLENVYLSRYWQIMDDLALVGADVEARQLHILRYLRLSEDQCDLQARRRVTESTWRYWRVGILEQLSEADFRVALQAAPAELFDHLRRLAGDPEYDPALRVS